MAAITWIAHRGYCQRYPENTLPSLRGALATGVRHLEVDLQVTADRVPILLHDSHLLRLCGLDAYVQDFDWPEVARMDAYEPQRFGERFRGTRIMTLRAFVEMMREWPDVHVFLEIKDGSTLRFGNEFVLDLVLAEAQSILQRCTIISFVAEITRLCLRDKTGPTGWVITDWDDANKAVADGLQVDYLLCSIEQLPADDAEVWQGDWQWILYSVNDRAAADRYFQRGFSWLETDAIGEVLGD